MTRSKAAGEFGPHLRQKDGQKDGPIGYIQLHSACNTNEKGDKNYHKSWDSLHNAENEL